MSNETIQTRVCTCAGMQAAVREATRIERAIHVHVLDSGVFEISAPCDAVPSIWAAASQAEVICRGDATRGAA